MSPAFNVSCSTGAQTTSQFHVEPQSQSSLSRDILTTSNSIQHLRLSESVAPTRTGLDFDVSPPVLDCSRNALKPEFENQAELDQQWGALKEYLTSAMLSEQEILDVFSSGILQKETGKVLRERLKGAMERSIRSHGALGKAKVKEILDALCDLPPSQWQAALGENVKFESAQNAAGLMNFIQTRLEFSGIELDKKIAQKQLVSDSQWDAIKDLTRDAKQYVRSWDFGVRDAWDMLKEDCERRPSPKEAQAHLTRLVTELRESGERKRWNDKFIEKVQAVCDQLDPGYRRASSEPARERPVELISLRFFNPPTPHSSAPTLLERIESFERHANFYSHINTAGTHKPETLLGKVLLACNVMDTFGVLRLDSRHISTSRPVPEPSSRAWKNGSADFTESPFEPAAGQPQPSTCTEPLTTLTQAIAKADEWLTRNLVPWNSVGAVPENVEIKIEELLEPVYKATTAILNDQPSAVVVVREQVNGLLERMAANLVSNGAAVLSSAGALLERNPGRTTGAFAAYVAVSNFYAYWFAPEASPIIVPAEQSSDWYGVSDPATDIRENILDDLAFMFEEFPELALALEERVEQSIYVEPHLDLQLLEDIDILLRQPSVADSSVSYLELIEEIIRLSVVDEDDEVEDFLSAGAQPAPLPVSRPLIRKVRSVTSEVPDNPVATNSVRGSHWVIERARENKMQPKAADGAAREIAPGITIDVARDKVVDALKSAEAIVDPLAFLQNSVDTIISESSLPDDWKRTLNSTSTVDVRFKEITLPDKFGYASPRHERVMTFTLAELCADYHLRVKASNEEMTIQWPAFFPEALKNTILNADLQAAYKDSVKSTLERPDVKELWKLAKEYELNTTLESHENSGTASPEGINLVNKFRAGKIRPQSIYLNNPRENTPAKVSNAVYLGDPDGFGLFVFLGGDTAVFELPAVGTQRQDVIESNEQLQGKLLDRIPLYEKLSRVDSDFKFGKPEFSIFNFYPRYAPVLFDTTDDAMGELYKRQLVQVLSDIDTLVSTDEERFTDGLVAAIGKLMTAMSIVTIVPGATVLATKGARMAASFLFGASASSTELIRGEMSDDPKAAAGFRANAYRGFIMECAGPLAGRLLGRVIAKSVATRIARAVFNRITSMIHKLPKPVKWIAPVVKNPLALTAKLELKFKSHRTVSQLQKLNRGPEFAQTLIKDTKVVYFSGPTEGYVYQGFVMRGDMRPPQEVFGQGFKLRTPITDVNQVNGMRGGFGGGKNALDMDGMGISTSPYYKHSGAGAYQYGGGRGGYTYVVDARQMRGYHLYANDHWKKYPTSKLGMRPYEVNYGQDIPASAVIGCYDKQGKFIPNPTSLKNSIEASKPVQLDGGILYRPAKSFIPSANATTASFRPL